MKVLYNRDTINFQYAAKKFTKFILTKAYENLRTEAQKVLTYRWRVSEIFHCCVVLVYCIIFLNALIVEA